MLGLELKVGFETGIRKTAERYRTDGYLPPPPFPAPGGDGHLLSGRGEQSHYMIGRNVNEAIDRHYELIVVGGGIYGVSLAMEAARRGVRPLLIERDDFGGATSWNSHRILHGGFRYLQTLDLKRFRESVQERRWFCQQFPDLVRPLKCLMPLYGSGLRRPSVFKAALLINDLMSRKRNVGVRGDRQLPNGRLLSVAETESLCEMVDRRGLRGGGLWYDAVMTNSQRVVIELLHWACHNGATALNYVECRAPLLEGQRIAGVRAVDHVAGQMVEFRAPVLINCGGPWCRELARRLDRDEPRLFRPSLAFAALLDRPPLSDAALAVTPNYPGARTYFLHPWRCRILAGTFHAPWDGPTDQPQPRRQQIGAFITDLNAAVPDLNLTTADIIRLYPGLLPAEAEGAVEVADREVIVDHSKIGGAAGLWSVSGVKFTTARLVAEKALQRAFGARGRDLRVQPGTDRPQPGCDIDHVDPSELLRGRDEEIAAAIRGLIQREAVVHLDDLLLRRTDWGLDPKRADAVARRVTSLIGWEGPNPVVEARDICPPPEDCAG